MTPAELAKGALRRLAQARQEPTPENYARAWAEEAGQPPPGDPRQAGSLWAGLIERVVRGLERSARQWTPARKKDSLQRVLQGSARDAQRLQQRLQALLQAWETDAPDAPVGQGPDGPAPVAAGARPAAAAAVDDDDDDDDQADADAGTAAAADHQRDAEQRQPTARGSDEARVCESVLISRGARGRGARGHCRHLESYRRVDTIAVLASGQPGRESQL